MPKRSQCDSTPVQRNLLKIVNLNRNFISSMMIVNCLAREPDSNRLRNGRDNGQKVAVKRNCEINNNNSTQISIQWEDVEDDFWIQNDPLQQTNNRRLHRDPKTVNSGDHLCTSQLVQSFPTKRHLFGFTANMLGMESERNSTMAKKPILYQNKNNACQPISQDQYLIVTYGESCSSVQKIGIKHIQAPQILKCVDQSPISWQISTGDKYETVDSIIELDSPIGGMCVSPDHRFLFVNNRSRCDNNRSAVQRINMHVIDLETKKKLGALQNSPEVFPDYSEDGCAICLDANKKYIVSGTEDTNAYLWDRYYGICLLKYPHKQPVNMVALNPVDSEMLITISNDSIIKVWRSKAKVGELVINGNSTRESAVYVL